MTARDETPRTDAAAFPILSRLQSGTEDVVEVSLARELERSLSASQEECERLRAEQAAFDTWHCESGGCAVSEANDVLGGYRKQAREWVDKYHEIKAERDQLRAEIERVREALRDMLSGWVYVRATYGDLQGVGWDRAQDKAESALSKEPRA